MQGLVVPVSEGLWQESVLLSMVSEGYTPIPKKIGNRQHSFNDLFRAEFLLHLEVDNFLEELEAFIRTEGVKDFQKKNVFCFPQESKLAVMLGEKAIGVLESAYTHGGGYCLLCLNPWGVVRVLSRIVQLEIPRLYDVSLEVIQAGVYSLYLSALEMSLRSLKEREVYCVFSAVMDEVTVMNIKKERATYHETARHNSVALDVYSKYGGIVVVEGVDVRMFSH
jgi:hypothetical protein